MISFISQSNGEKVMFEKGKFLAEGTYFNVYALNKNGMETDLVCKELVLQHPKNTSFFSRLNVVYSRSYRLWVATSELKWLHTFGLLIGYENVNDTFYIIVPKIEGISLSDAYEKANKHEIFYHAFKTLKEFHRLGYSHLDPHPGNFIVSEGEPPKILLIDFSRTQEASFLGNFLDYKIFLPYLPSNCSAINFYIREIIEHSKKHKVEVAKDFFISAFFVTSAIYGVQSLSIEPYMIRRFLWSIFLNKAANSLEFTRIMGVFPIALFSLQIRYQGALFNWENGPALLMDGEGIFNPVTWLNTAYLYTPISRICKTTSEFLDDYILPECVVKKKTDLFFKYVYPTSTRLLSKAKEVIWGSEPEKVRTRAGPT